MRVTARKATADDIDALLHLYGGLKEEMIDLHPMWPLADGLPDPVRDSLLALLDDPDALVIVGDIDDYPFGLLVARVENLLPQADGEQVGAIRFVFVERDAREVGVGEVMRDLAMHLLRDLGISRFDAHVLPGHRLAKNFFEAGGFSARSIVMHHDDRTE